MAMHGLVERDALLDELADHLRDAARDGGRMVLLSGSAGVGKSAVVRALAARTPSGVRRLTGWCDALGTPQPLAPLLDMLDQSPSLGAAARGTRHELFSAVVHELSTAQTLAVIEDVHWADAATADLIVHLGRRVSRTRSLVVLTFRDEDLHPAHPIRIALDGLATQPGIVRRAIEPLSLQGVGELVAGRQIDVAQLHARTGGNPFFVTEVLAAPGWAVPPTVADAVRARARRLPPAARAVLDTMAVETGAVRVEQLLALGHGAPDIDAAVASGMLEHDGARLSFRHELARQGVLGDLAPASRAVLHRSWLRLLARGPARDTDAARLAAHALGAGNAPAIVTWSRLAADYASRRGTHGEAVRHLQDALAVDELERAERADVLATLAGELGHLDRRHEAERACEAALRLRRELRDAAGVATALADLARAHWSLGDGARARRAMADAVSAAQQLPVDRDPRTDRAIAYVHARAAYLAMLARDGSTATRSAAAAVHLARPRAIDDVLVVALNALGSTMLVGQRDLGGVQPLEEALAIATDLDRDADVADALANLGSALGEIREYERAARYLERAMLFSEARDLDAARHYANAWLARVRFEQGRWAEAATLVGDAEEGEGASPVSAIVRLTVEGTLRARKGEPVGALLDEAWELAVRTDDVQRLWPVAAARAEQAWLAGRGASAAAAAADDIAARASALGLDWARDELAFWGARLGRASPPPEHCTTPFALQLAGSASAAAREWAQIGCPYEEAAALADCTDEAALRRALEALQRLGARPLAARVRRRLRELGASAVPLGPRAAGRAHPSGLTRQQLAVLELLATGLSDRQIGDRLSLSPKTVGHHVSAVLATLGVEGRLAAARLALERGWAANLGSPPQVASPRGS